MPATNLLPCNAGQNFWSLGDIGPFGTCSEIYFDRQMLKKEDKSTSFQIPINVESPTLMELWNIVFMKYNKFFYFYNNF